MQQAIRVLFTQPIFTKPGLNRVTVVTTVANLGTTINNFQKNKVTIEHVYDY